MAIRQGTPGTWNAELKLNGMGSVDVKPITVCESVFIVQISNHLGQGLRGCVAEACGAPPADLLHRGVMDDEETMSLATPSLSIFVSMECCCD